MPVPEAANITLSYTNPITGETAPRDWGMQYLELDGVLLVVRHFWRGRERDWSAEVFTDHLESRPLLEWAKAGGGFGFAHVRRAGLLKQITALVGTEEWAQKRALWLAIPRDRQVPRRYRIVRRDLGAWWAVPTHPQRDRERGPYADEESVRTAFGDAAA